MTPKCELTMWKLDEDNKPIEISFDEWSKEFKGPRRIGRTMVEDKLVSTVFLHVPHKPYFFETMAFVGNVATGDCDRYRTFEEAEVGHLARVKEELEKL